MPECKGTPYRLLGSVLEYLWSDALDMNFGQQCVKCFELLFGNELQSLSCCKNSQKVERLHCFQCIALVRNSLDD